MGGANEGLSQRRVEPVISNVEEGGASGGWERRINGGLGLWVQN